MPEDRLLAIAASGQRVGFVFLSGHEVAFWQVSRKAGRKGSDAREVLQDMIGKLRPTLVIVQDGDNLTGRRRKRILNALADEAAKHRRLMLRRTLKKRHRNKYKAAKALVAHYPIMASQCPPPRQVHHGHEPHTIVLFSALGLAHQYLVEDDPVISAAAAMG